MKFSTAILISLVFHAVLVAGIGLYLAKAPSGITVAELDLSSVELSFAEEESEAAPTAASVPGATAARTECGSYQAPGELGEPTAKIEDPPPTPPAAAAMKLPEPAERAPEMDMPEPAVTRRDSASTAAPTEAPPVAASAPRQARVDAPPALKKTIRPDYPRGARMRGEEGDVALEIAVDAKGDVTDVSVLSACPHAELNEAAVKAVRKAHFSPARQGSASVACTVRLTLTFRLRD